MSLDQGTRAVYSWAWPAHIQPLGLSLSVAQRGLPLAVFTTPPVSPQCINSPNFHNQLRQVWRMKPIEIFPFKKPGGQCQSQPWVVLVGLW